MTSLLSWLDRTALTCILLLPPLLLHAHGIAEVTIAIADLCFLGRSFLRRDWRWTRSLWVQLAGAWWGWIVICSLPLPAIGLGEGRFESLVQAIAVVRFLLLAACLEHMALRGVQARRWLFAVIAASAAWIGLNALLQQITGHNLLGWPRSGDGELTGPFRKPRAGPVQARILIPAILPPVTALLLRRRPVATLGAYALLFLSVTLMVLIGQRMPLVISVFGLAIAAVLMPRLRTVVLAASVAGGVLLAASPIVAPHAYYRLVEKFSMQMESFGKSHYGKLYARALEIGVQNPVTGLGFDGFATGCPLPRYFRPSFDFSIADGGGATICWNHPHNYYFQALDDGGFIGLALFAGAAIAWLGVLGSGLWRDPEPLRVGLFAAVLVQLWPIQSNTSFYGMPVGGWFFLLLGWGLAESRWRTRPADPSGVT